MNGGGVTLIQHEMLHNLPPSSANETIIVILFTTSVLYEEWVNMVSG